MILKNQYSFENMPNGQSQVKITMPSGECMVIGFMSDFPLQAAQFYYSVIENVTKRVPIGSAEDYFQLFTQSFARHNLELPFSVGFDKDTQRERIGAKIREIRESKNIDAKILAKIAGIDAANLCRIEQGKYSVGLDILDRIARSMGYKLDIVPNE